MTVSTGTGSTATSGRTTLVLLVGVAAGLLSGLFGVGGGILLVPGLVMVAAMDQRLAHGTSLAAVLPISAASLVTYAAHGNVDWAVALFLAVGAVVGAVVGTRLLHVVPYRTLALSFAALLVVSAVRLFVPVDAAGRAALGIAGAVALVVIGTATGVLAGLLGVGGGVVMIPAMVVLFDIVPVDAKGTSLAVIIPTAIMGTWRNRANANADLRAATILGLGGIASAFAGAWVSDKMSPTLSNALFAALLLVVALRLVRGVRRHQVLADEDVVEP